MFKYKKRVKVLEKSIEILNKDLHDLRIIIQKMWDETHPPTMGGK